MAVERLRSVTMLVLLSLPLTVTPLRAQGADADSEDSDEGQHLYIARGCLGCHGASGRGGVGPALAGTRLPMEAFLHQLREPRDIMPVFPAEIVSEDDAEEIHEYLSGLAPDVPRLRAELPGALAREFGVRAVALAADAVTAYVGALGSRPGAVVAAGTGLIAVGTDLKRWRRADGCACTSPTPRLRARR